MGDVMASPRFVLVRWPAAMTALETVVAWPDRPRGGAAGGGLVVTGSPGVGKSAVLGRVVTTADAALRALLPAGDAAMRATVGSVACAVPVCGRVLLASA